MSKMRVRVEVEIFDELGESHTLTGGTKTLAIGGNPRFFAGEFDDLAHSIQADIHRQIAIKHGDRRADA